MLSGRAIKVKKQCVLQIKINYLMSQPQVGRVDGVNVTSERTVDV